MTASALQNTQTSMRGHVLVIDDDARLRALLARYLGAQGWLVTCARDVPDAHAKLNCLIFDLIVLDLMMPGESGLDFAKAWRRQEPIGMRTPILMLTAMAGAQDRIAGLEAGADDYLTKPFEPRELVLRLENIMQRAQPFAPAPAPVNTGSPPKEVHFGDYVLDVSAKRLSRSGSHIHLTEAEMSALCLLAGSQGSPVTREALGALMASGGTDANPRSADVLMTRLRRKIEDDPARPAYLHTVRGKGYVLR